MQGEGAAPPPQKTSWKKRAPDRNVKHTCDKAWQTLLRAQGNRAADETEPALSSGPAAAGACVVPGPAKRRKRQPTAVCEGNPDAAGPNPLDAACTWQLTSASPEDEVVINSNTSTVHLMSDISAVETRRGCSMRLARLRVQATCRHGCSHGAQSAVSGWDRHSSKLTCGRVVSRCYIGHSLHEHFFARSPNFSTLPRSHFISAAFVVRCRPALAASLQVRAQLETSSYFLQPRLCLASVSVGGLSVSRSESMSV